MEEKIFSSILKTYEFKKDFKEIWKMEDRIRNKFTKLNHHVETNFSIIN